MTVTAPPRRRSSPSGRSRTAAATRRRRAAARRRRRIALGLAAVAVVVVVLLMALPAAKRAVNVFGLPLQYSATIRQQAAQKHLDPALVAAVIYAETKFDPRTSAAGAEGPMQIMPSTALFLARRSGAKTFTTADLLTPEVNIAYGSYYIRYLLDAFHGNEMLAIAAYNGGLGNVRRWEASARAAGSTLTIDRIPFPETRAYVQKVLTAQQDYRRTYPGQLGYG